MKIEIRSFGNEKVKAIKIVREATGLGLKEAKDFVESVDMRGRQILDNVTENVVEELRSIGASVRAIDEGDDYERAMREDSSVEVNIAEEEGSVQVEMTSTSNFGSAYQPIVASNMISELDREGAMKVLLEVGKIAKELEGYDLEINQLISEKNRETAKAEALRKVVSGKAKAIIWLVIIIAFCVGLCLGPLCIVTGTAAWIIMNCTVKKADLKKHEAENNANADNYYDTYVVPIQSRLDEVHKLRDILVNCGKRDWAIDVVGRDLFYSACIQDLYNLIKNRRADNLKEALNKYDDAQYKARMEEMQAAIQNATEVSAREAVKQTVYAQETAKNTHQAATAAKATAYNTRQIDKNTRRFR